VAYSFEWDPKKAASNLKANDVSFDEAASVFGDILSLNMPDPDHSEDERRFLVIGRSGASRLIVVAYAERPRELASSALASRRSANRTNMRTTRTKAKVSTDAGTMRPEYDFSKGVRGVTAGRYAQGTNVVLLDPDVAEVFPDSRAVNEALRTFARLARSERAKTKHKRTA
jgi:uncharacterized DUF497 family protein